MRRATLTALTGVTILAAGLVPLTATPANAMPAGWFHLRGTTKDKTAPFALRSMDVQWAPDGKINGFVRLNASGFAKDSQLWKVRFPRTGKIGEVKLENKLTGQCIAFGAASSPDGGNAVVLGPCSGNTVWMAVPMGVNKYVFRSRAYYPDHPFCLSKSTVGSPEFLRIKICSDNRFTPEMVWEAYSGG
ncbi:RICIN domain-containing protein [Microbispora sp. NEAU-D428]|uniref:RICIN domain-containing protein n=1 Tax=Microbispora sitophila TaxID=2771537 RepID=UPI0018679ED6|nr:RICIN domain-containing protein [Microbispora sitophila]MBE3014829.1 RICIN domain-containing protein [Microbispora sitophila]